jgi:transcription initiation factor TFIID subunit TAF12
VHPSQLVEAHSIINAADYALLLVDGSSSSNAQQAANGSWPVLYANQAAVDALSSSSSAGQVEPAAAAVAALQQVQLPAAVSAMLEQQQQLLQQQSLSQQQQQQQQQQGSSQAQLDSSSSSSSCAVLHQVDWQPLPGPGSGSLTAEQLLCCHVHAPNGERHQQLTHSITTVTSTRLPVNSQQCSCAPRAADTAPLTHLHACLSATCSAAEL